MIYTYGVTQRGAYHVKHGTLCQDAHKIVARTDGIVIAAVADGLGSQEHSDIASKIAADVSTAYCQKHITSSSTCEEICNVIEISFQLAQNAIEKKARSNEHGIEQYDTTLTLAVVIGDTLYYGHSGDSGIIVLTDAGLYEQVTEQQRDDEGRVFPLFREDRWVFGRYEKKVASVLLATDGLFETLIPVCLKDDPVKIHVRLARFFMDNRYLHIDKLGEGEVRSRINQFVADIPAEQVDDDKTVVVLVNTDVSYVLEPGKYADLPDVFEREEERKKKAKEELYPHLFRDKKHDDATEVSLPMSVAKSDDVTKEEQGNVSFDEKGEQGGGAKLLTLVKSAESGDAKAQLALGDCYYYGKGVDRDYENAVHWWVNAAEQGNARAQHNLGYCYYKGLGVEQSDEKAIHWYMLAAGQGYADAQYNLGYRYQHGVGVAKDKAKAIHWYTKAAEQGNAKAQDRLKSLKSTTSVNPGVKKKGKNVIIAAIVLLIIAACACFAVFHGNNVKVPESSSLISDVTDAKVPVLLFGEESISDTTYHVNQTDKALDDLVARAMQGDAAAQYDLGYRYQHGIGVEKDEEKAVEWYTKAAEQGYADAQDRLQFLNDEKGIFSDDSEFKDLPANTTQGDADAQNSDGWYYDNGIGGKTVEWYTKAAEQGHFDAQDRLISL